MKTYQTIIAAVVAGLACTAATSKAQVAYDFSGDTGITFNGNSTFQLDPIGGTQFTGEGTQNGITGYVSGGAWTFNDVTGAIAGGGVLTLTDGIDTITGNVILGSLTIVGAVGAENVNAQVNVTGLTITGIADPTLAAILAGETSGIFDLTFQETSGITLATLAGNKSTTSFSGSFAAVPEPSTYVAGALMLLPFGVGALRSLRKDRVA